MRTLFIFKTRTIPNSFSVNVRKTYTFYYKTYTKKKQARIKRRKPHMLTGSPNQPDWAPLLIIWEGHIVTATFLVELPRELGDVICTGIVGT